MTRAIVDAVYVVECVVVVVVVAAAAAAAAAHTGEITAAAAV